MSDIQTTLIQGKPNKQYRDRLFKAIFGRDTEQSKRWRLDLYNALNGTHYSDPDALEVNTIENVIYMTMKNDISFLVDSQMTLYEQQSTYNPNMPLRGLFYFSQLYQMYIEKNDKNILISRLVKIPEPRFVVFYNGTKRTQETFKLRLSDAFERTNTETVDSADISKDFEWTATVININPGHNSALQKNCKPLYDYVCYVGRVAENKKQGLSTQEAVNNAVNWAIREKLLDGFFKVNKAEVTAMCLTEYDEEAAQRAFREDGYLDGKQDKAIEDASSFYANGASVELIAKSLQMTVEQVEEIVKDSIQEKAYKQRHCMTWERQRAYDYDDGKEAGKQEKAVETAKNFLNKGVSPEIIAECTGLSLEEVEKFATEVSK